MMARLYKLVFPNPEDEDHLRLADLLRIISYVVALLAIVYLPVTIIFNGVGVGAFLSFAALLLAGLIYGMVRRGYIRAGGLILVFSLWLLMTLAGLADPTTYDLSIGSYTLVVLFAGILFGGTSAVMAAVFTSLTSLIFLLTHVSSLPGSNPVGYAILNWASHTIIFFIAAALLMVADRNIRDALRRTRSGEQALAERNNQLTEEIAIRTRMEKELVEQEGSLRRFQGYLKALHDVNIELSSLNNLNDLYRSAVQAARERLGFDRVGIFLLDEASDEMVGTWGTDDKGQIRDERTLRSKIPVGRGWVLESLESKTRVSIRQNVPLYDNWQQIGYGWNAMAGLWDGKKIIGWLASDNLLNRAPLEDYQLELLSLFGSMLGHLIAQKQAEEALRTNEDLTLQFQQRLKALYEVTIELAKIANLEDFYHSAVELGRNRLGFDRIGLFLKDEKTNTLVGAYGTDEDGNIADNRAIRSSLTGDTWGSNIYAKIDQQQIRIQQDAPLYHQLKPVGTGWHVIAPLWNGEKVVGWISLDNLFNHKPLLAYEIEIITLYGSMLGHLYVQKQSNQELRQSQEQLSLALKAAQMRAWDWDLETDEITRTGSGINLPPYPTYQEFLKHVHPDDRERIYAAVRQAVAQNSIYTAEYRFENVGGGWGWLYTVGQAYRDASGKAIGMAGVSQDVTERKRAEEALKRSEERFYKAFHGNPSAISIMTVSEHRYVDVNESWLKLFGYTREECVGHTTAEMDTWVDRGEHKKWSDQLDRDGGLYGVEVARRTKSGTTIYVSLYCDKIEIAGELFYLTMLQDLSERKVAEKQALELAIEKERVELLREFVGNISHDLKTPLTVINNSLYLLERLTDPIRRQDNLDIIRMQTRILDRQIQDILTISRLDYAPQINHNPVNIASILRAIEERLRPSIEKNILNVTLEAETGLPMIIGDEGDLDRALVNLVENALNYTNSGGSIHIRAFTEDDGVIIEVSDTGMGINESDIPYIFDRFYRSPQARTALKTGTGLGLAIVKKIIVMHQGTIEVESQVGKGSTFRIWLPAIQEPVQ